MVDGNKLLTYASSRRKGLRCYEITPAGAKELWSYHGAADSGSSPVVMGGHVYVQGGIRLACVDLKTGDEKWQTTLKMSNPRYTSLVGADGKVFYAWQGLLGFAADPSGFKPLFQGQMANDGLLATEDTHRRLLKLDGLDNKKAESIYKKNVGGGAPETCTSPALADGKIYFRTRNGVVCYDLRRGSK